VGGKLIGASSTPHQTGAHEQGSAKNPSTNAARQFHEDGDHPPELKIENWKLKRANCALPVAPTMPDQFTVFNFQFSISNSAADKAGIHGCLSLGPFSP
jgi:hypothetical protein